MKDQYIRLMFPVQLTKAGKVRKKQLRVVIGYNAAVLQFQRGVAVDAPAWVKDVCDRSTVPTDYECFVSGPGSKEAFQKELELSNRRTKTAIKRWIQSQKKKRKTK